MFCFEVFRGFQYTIILYIHFKLDRSINDLIKSWTKIRHIFKFCAEAKMMDVSSWLKITIRPRVVYCCRILPQLSLRRISYCCADALFSHVFAFIAVNKDETMECHAFLCRKRKIVIIRTLFFEIVNLLILGSSCISNSRSSIQPGVRVLER